MSVHEVEITRDEAEGAINAIEMLTETSLARYHAQSFADRLRRTFGMLSREAVSEPASAKTIAERWEDGVPHDPRSEAIVRGMAKIDFEECGDSLQINIGGDGDNGETMMYILDVYFERKDRGE